MDLLHRHRKVFSGSVNNNYRPTNYSSQQSTHKSTKINYAHYVGSASISRQTLMSNPQLSKPSTAQMRNRNSSGVAKGMNAHFLYLRKENHLNTCFNVRKNKLKEMTKANKQLYQKLNNQKSLYSNSEMNRSYQSIKQIKDRLSQSKLSQRSNLSRSLSRESSRKSLKCTKSMKGFQKPKQMPLQVKAFNINQASHNEIDKFRGLFQKDAELKTKQTIDNSEDMFRYNSFQRKGPYMRSLKISGRGSFRSSKCQKAQQSQEGGLLHRIVQDLKQNRGTTIKRTR